MCLNMYFRIPIYQIFTKNKLMCLGEYKGSRKLGPDNNRDLN